MNKIFLFLILLTSQAVAQEPSQEIAALHQSHVFVVTLFDITRHDLYKTATETFSHARGVVELRPTIMQRGYIELQGKYTESAELLKTEVNQSLNHNFSVTTRQGEDGVLEFILKPPDNNTSP